MDRLVSMQAVLQPNVLLVNDLNPGIARVEPIGHFARSDYEHLPYPWQMLFKHMERELESIQVAVALPTTCQVRAILHDAIELLLRWLLNPSVDHIHRKVFCRWCTTEHWFVTTLVCSFRAHARAFESAIFLAHDLGCERSALLFDICPYLYKLPVACNVGAHNLTTCQAISRKRVQKSKQDQYE